KVAFRQARVQVLPEEECEPKDIADTQSVIKSSLQYAIDSSDKTARALIEESVPKHLIKTILEETSLSKLTDMLTQVLKLDFQTRLMLLSSTNPVERGRIIISALNGYSYRSELEGHILDLAKKSMEKNQKEYFLAEQLKAIKKELGVNVTEDDDIEQFKTRNQELKAPNYVHERIDREIRKLNSMSINSSEYSVVRNYIDTLLSLPWEVSSTVNYDLKKAKETLDKEHYGLTKVKDKILEYLAIQSRTDKLHGPIICLMGPPGIGKTSLGKSIANATGRKFVRLALGGMHDEAEIRGHRRTYIGALPGRIIANMAKVGVNNPLFLLDEIDKVVSSNQGDPSSALLEVLDPEQNSTFEDNYVEIEYDLSNVMFVTTANSYNIPAPLLDRMEIIDLSSYTEDEKLHIAKEHLFPKQLRLANVSNKEILISDEVLLHLIRYYTHEAGVRELERILIEIIRKTVKDFMIKNPKAKKLTPKQIELSDIQGMLGPNRYDFTSKLNDNKVGIVNGLSWSTLGGDILQLEAVANIGKGKHQVTGKLGDVMKESITIAISVVRTLAQNLHLNQDFFETSDLHVHVPEGAVPKDGPSAGVGMVTAIVSALTGNRVRSDVAMTGEITLRGDVLPIGGLKEKLLAALRGGIKTVLIPKENEKDLWDIPKIVSEKMNLKFVSRIEEVLSVALENDPNTFIPTTHWKAKDKKVSANTKRKTKNTDTMNIVL
ncbi:MAG: endopeptidase La, partial [Succinivibrio sp.]|nr:endopeptidase La [Succinivibrio sp.]